MARKHLQMTKNLRNSQMFSSTDDPQYTVDFLSWSFYWYIVERASYRACTDAYDHTYSCKPFMPSFLSIFPYPFLSSWSIQFHNLFSNIDKIHLHTYTYSNSMSLSIMVIPLMCSVKYAGLRDYTSLMSFFNSIWFGLCL